LKNSLKNVREQASLSIYVGEQHQGYRKSKYKSPEAFLEAMEAW
jgi:hypothetical protein